MKNLTYLLTVLFLMAAPLLYGQVRLDGFVRDGTSEQLLPFANLQLLQGDKLLTYCSTDVDGAYHLAYDQRVDSLMLKVTYLGYRPKVIPLKVHIQKNLIIGLDTREQELQEVIIKGEGIGVDVKLDTLKYNLEMFTNGSEKKLEDILRKLPGVEIRNGEIYVNGEKVNKLLIDGKDFLSEQQGLATKNLPAVFVDDISFLNNYEDPNRVGIRSKRKTAISINIKEEYRNSWVGDIDVSGGYESKYLGHANIFQFRNKSHIMLIGDANNVGIQNYTLNDYLRANSSEDDEDGAIVKDGSIGNMLSDNDELLFRKSELGVINYYHQPNSKISTKVFALFNHSKSEENYLNNTQFLDQDSSLNINHSNSSSDAWLTLGNLSFTLKPKQNLGFEYRLHWNLFDDNYRNRLLNKIALDSQQYRQQDQSRVFNLDQQITVTRALSNRRTVKATFEYNRAATEGKIGIISDHSFLGLPFHANEDFGLNIDSEEVVHALNAKLEMTNRFKKHDFLLYAGSSNERLNLSQYNRELGFENADIAALDAHSRLNYLKFFSGLSISKVHGFLQYFGKVDLAQNRLVLTQQEEGADESFNDWVISPEARVTFKFNPLHRLTFLYSFTNDYLDIQDVNEATQIRDAQGYTQGALPFRTALPKHNYSVRHFWIRPDINMNMSMFFNHRRVARTSTSNSVSFENYAVQTRMLGKGSYTTFAHLNFSKKIRRTPIHFKVNLYYQNFVRNAFLMNLNNQIETNRHEEQISFFSNFSVPFNFEVGLESSENLSKVSLSEASSRLVTLSPFIYMVYYTEKGWEVSANFEYISYRLDSSRDRSVYDLNFRVSYRKPETHFEYGISANNLLNITSPYKVTTDVSPAAINEQIVNTLPGNMLLSIKYHLQL